MLKFITVLLALSPLVMGQQAGTRTPEHHPPLTWQQCQSGGHCSTVHGSIVLDSNWRWIHNAAGQNCHNGNSWDHASCPDELTCAKNCQIDGNQYSSGVSTSGSAIHITSSSRYYLLADEHHYQMFHLLGQEFTFDMDVSRLGCGMNGGVYLIAMDADGGASKHPTNKAGAKYGTGYCDAQCFKDVNFVEGKANIHKNVGVCCGEMDIIEANSMSAATTAHPCTHNGFHTCNGDSCGGGSGSHRYSGTCDPDGCEYNSYRMGDHSFFGPGKTVDTHKVITVVTQFITSNGSPSGQLTEIRRFYVQNGRVIPNSRSTYSAVPGNSLSEHYCSEKKAFFKEGDTFIRHGGLKQMGDNMRSGMALVVTLWGGNGEDMAWLDSTVPKNAPASQPGAARGPCPGSGQSHQGNQVFVVSNIRVGPLNSTFHH